jgi:predicted Fe-Mo cluster-binding NifX family protein
MKTIAIPIFKSRVSVRLDCAEYIHLITLERGVVKNRETMRLITANSLEKIKVLIKLNPDVLICGGLTEFCQNRLKNTDIQIIPWVRGDIEEILAQYLEGKLNQKDSPVKTKM